MAKSKIRLRDITDRIQLPESEGEKQAIGLVLLEQLPSVTRTFLLAGGEIAISEEQEQMLHDWILRVNNAEPVQYITGHAPFYGRDFIVTPDVLIPRPETELLVDVVKEVVPAHGTILDIGTGSGCIAITLAKELPGTTVTATDVSEAALAVARKNASLLNAGVKFLRHDILHENLMAHFDVIVSNPPYIQEHEIQAMDRNVTQFEPHLALFVPDNDPMMFYKAIAQKAMIVLKAGCVCVEINERFGREVVEVFNNAGYRSDLRQDLDGKNRIVIARFE